MTAYDPGLFAGAAAHYRHGRPPYSPQLEAVLAEELGLDGSGRLLDGGCEPGTLTVRLAPLFEEAIGLDPDAAMLVEGRRAAEQAGVANIHWVQALAEELPEAAPGPYRLITFGQSFHWTDEARVAEALYDMLEPGGALALIVHTVEGRPTPPSPGPPPIPHAEIEQLVEQHLRRPRRPLPKRTHRFEDVLVRTRFGRPRQIFATGIPDLLRNTESVLAGYFSMSTSNRRDSTTASRTSRATYGSCWPRGRPRACSGTGRATRRSFSAASPADPGQKVKPTGYAYVERYQTSSPITPPKAPIQRSR